MGVFVTLSEAYTDAVFIKVDVDENEETAQEYDVTAMPTSAFIKSGKKIDTVVGASEEKLRPQSRRTCEGRPRRSGERIDAAFPPRGFNDGGLLRAKCKLSECDCVRVE